MFEYIKGTLAEINPAYTVIESGGIGYFIHISLNTYSALSGKESSILYLHQIVREDLNALYGFIDKNEREIFRLLISVSGIGANTARMMLSSLNPAELRIAILENDVNKLKSVKGIGLKTAQRVIIELKDKLGKTGTSDEIFSQPDNTLKDEALSALIMLGFPKKAVEKAIDKIVKSEPGISVEDLVKKALKIL